MGIILFSCALCEASSPVGNIEELIRSLKASDPEVRRVAAYRLGESQDVRGVEPLLTSLQDPSPRVRSEVATGLAALKDLRAVVPLIGALQDPDAFVRQRVGEALGRLRDDRAIRPLMQGLNDVDAGARAGAADGLGLLKAAAAFEPLLTMLKEDHNSAARHSAAWALGQLRDARAVEPLISTVQDRNQSVRLVAVSALGEIGDKRAVEPLIGCLQDADPIVRRVAAKALGKLHDPRALGTLASLQSDPDKDVQESSQWALQKIQQPVRTKHPATPVAAGSSFNPTVAFGILMVACTIIAFGTMYRKWRQQGSPRSALVTPTGWRIAEIPDRTRGSNESWKANWAAAPVSMSLCLAGVLMFVGAFVRVFARGNPTLAVFVVIVVGWLVAAFGLLLANRARRRDWIRVESDCVDREYRNLGKTWRLRLLCQFQFEGKEYRVTPYYYSTFGSEKSLCRFLAKAVTSTQGCRLWVNPRNPLETELAVGGLPDLLLH